MISIVLPAYNRVRYICQSIDSVINQSRQDWELIIVDDASTEIGQGRLQKNTAEGIMSIAVYGMGSLGM